MQDIMQFAGRHEYLSIAWIGLLVAVLYTTVKGFRSKVKTITRGETTHLINKESAVVLDIRQRDEFRKGHIVNAINLLPNEIKSGNFGELDKHKTQPVVVVDANGTSATETASSLVNAGFDQVYQLKDGISGWISENLPLVRSK